MKLSAILILLLHSIGAAAQFTHEIAYVVGCFEDDTTEAQYEFDGEEILYVDFSREDLVYTVPQYFVPDPIEEFGDLNLYKNAREAKRACAGILTYLKLSMHPEEEKDPPESVLYPAEEVVLGVENSLVCFVNHFYPPSINVTWTKNNHPVTEGVSLSRYYPNSNQTFHQFSTLTFTPSEGDIYSCTVEHSALETPKTRFWDVELPKHHQSVVADVCCGVGLSLGLLGVAGGTFLFVKGQHQ
ncbi:H-2 class II histocompatibility antigen, A-U alpha chain-like [Stegastes partitus]|uniref:H-2 class II histocompatibility antigen, A-U alpha chain-like n=1 Tax=Stegastes partitus TaxID=144197 RepID=A0A3B5BIN2_9TELE|nr:PREDICTED: H-2 class II histocompatibility antigen, A-U alpha chain-like [Stegastes partitus]XP_008297764.1 PREDICTED: H-2 class II histocompatibility antigen, A-U alpha chain-like [Stegastes partitus]